MGGHKDEWVQWQEDVRMGGHKVPGGWEGRRVRGQEGMGKGTTSQQERV